MVQKKSSILDKYHPFVCGGFVGSILLANQLGYHNISDKFLNLQYPISTNTETRFDRGLQDVYFVVFSVCVIAICRAIYRETILKFAASYMKLSKSVTMKWLDSGWVACYFVCSWLWGISIFKDDEWFFDTKYFWINYPHNFDYDFKKYYLIQLSFWLTNLGMFFLEAQRRDYWQYFGHHVITISLILGSYYYYMHRIGAAILLLLDVGDIFYYHVKMLKYAGKEQGATIGFGLFMGVWFLTRHVLYSYVLYSVWFEFPKYLGFGYVSPTGINLSTSVWLSFSVGLVGLQGLMIFWFVMIVRLAIRVLKGHDAADETDELSEEEENEETSQETSKIEDMDSQGNVIDQKSMRKVADGADLRSSPVENKKKK